MGEQIKYMLTDTMLEHCELGYIVVNKHWKGLEFQWPEYSGGDNVESFQTEIVSIYGIGMCE